MGFRIVADSSANVLTWEGVNYATVPMKIVTEKEYVDNAELDVAGMVIDLQHHKGRSGSSCPNVRMAGCLRRCGRGILHHHHQAPVRLLQRRLPGSGHLYGRKSGPQGGRHRFSHRRAGVNDDRAETAGMGKRGG